MAQQQVPLLCHHTFEVRRAAWFTDVTAYRKGANNKNEDQPDRGFRFRVKTTLERSAWIKALKRQVHRIKELPLAEIDPGSSNCQTISYLCLRLDNNREKQEKSLLPVVHARFHRICRVIGPSSEAQNQFIFKCQFGKSNRGV